MSSAAIFIGALSVKYSYTLIHFSNSFQKYKEDMELDEEQLSSEVTKKQSAGDERTSSTTIGYAGIVFIVILFGLIFAADALRLYSVFCG